MKLKEGKRYDFLVEKTLRIGDNNYYLLKSPGDDKYLLRKEYYEHYDIQPGENINCRVDKINCRGEVYLEPENPYYTEGKNYDFRITGRDLRLIDSGEIIPVLLVMDKFDNELVVPINCIGAYDIDKHEYINLKIWRINKGRIFFEDPDSGKQGEYEEGDNVYEFLIRDKMTGVDGRDYYIVSDQSNSHHVIPADQYSHYGLKPGGNFKGRFIKYHDSGQYRVEPQNPYYIPGKKYEFKLISVHDKPDGPGKILIVGDRHGLRHEVTVPGDYQLQETLFFRVDKIRKGWPLLVPV